MTRIVRVSAAIALMLLYTPSLAQEGKSPVCGILGTPACKRAEKQKDELKKGADARQAAAERRHRLFEDQRTRNDNRRDGLEEPTELERYTVFDPSVGKKREVAILYASGDRAVIVVHGQYEPREVTLCSHSKTAEASARCGQVRRALTDAKFIYRGATARQIRVSAIGHADIQRVDGQLDLPTDIRTECRLRQNSENENDCIAYARARDFKSELLQVFAPQKDATHQETNRTVVHLSFDADPFMSSTNGALRGSLYKQLKLAETVDVLRKELGIGADWSPLRMRSDEEVQKRLRANPKLLEKLAPFRSVVIVLEPCGADMLCR